MLTSHFYALINLSKDYRNAFSFSYEPTFVPLWFYYFLNSRILKDFWEEYGFWATLGLIRNMGLLLFTLPGNKAGPYGLWKLLQV